MPKYCQSGKETQEAIEYYSTPILLVKLKRAEEN